MVIFQQQKISENLQRQGASSRESDRGRTRSTICMRVLNRITLSARSSWVLVAILPFIASTRPGSTRCCSSATSLLIVVGVAIDTMRQLEAQLIMRNYEGFIK